MSPWQSRHSRTGRSPGFTLVELLVVVLIIGILAAIALPRLLGQRTRAKNAAAQSAARHALVAARSYYTQNSETYAGLGPTQLRGYESSLSGTEPSDSQQPGASGANPQDIWIGNGLGSTNPDLVTNGDANGGNTVVLCSVSRGDAVYCVKDTNGVASYSQATGSAVSSAAAGSYSAGGWSATSPPPAWSSAVSGLGPTNWWRLNETVGSYSDSGSAGNASVSMGSFASGARGSASLVPSDASNKSAYFGGNGATALPASDTWISFGDVSDLTSSYSIMLALQSSATPPVDWYEILWKRVNQGQPTSEGIDIGVYNGTLYAEHYVNSKGAASVGVSYTYGSKVFAVVTYDSPTKTLKMYIDGNQVASSSAATQGDLANNSSAWYLGTRANNTTGFKGSVDEVAIWSGTALSANNVAALWSSYNGA